MKKLPIYSLFFLPGNLCMYKLILEKSSLLRTSFSIFLELLVGRLIKTVGTIQKKEVITH